jgi:RNA polymerase sigma-70 factor (ECF subfamily)
MSDLMTPPNDIALWIQQALAGNQEAFQQLYDRFAARLYRLCYGLVLNQEDAEDVTQESFVYAFRNLRRFDANRASFKTWLYTIAVSRCRNTYRRQVLPMLDLYQLLPELAAPSAESPEARLTQTHLNEVIGKALATLSPQLREAVILRYGHGLAYREIAEVMAIPSKTAESRVRLAHEQLRRTLGVQGRGLLDELLGTT